MAYNPLHGATPDDYTGGGGDDRYVLKRHDFSEHVSMGGGDDVVVSNNGGLTAGDQIDGGSGYDTLIINGPISDKVDFGAATLTNFEEIDLAGRGAYNLKLNSAMVGSGDTLTVTVTSSAVSGVKIDGSAMGLDSHLALFGSNGDDTLIGGRGADQLEGGTGSDLLVGGRGHDKFIFADTANGANWGHDLIKDFTVGSDKVVFETTSASSFADLTITDSKDGAVVSTNGHNAVFFYGYTASQITASDFIFESAPQAAGASHGATIHPGADLHHILPIA